MSTGQAAAMIAVMALATLLTRALPFALFPSGRKTPAVIDYLGRVLPCAVIGMLVVYCLKDVDLSAPSGGAPEAIAIAAICLLYLWRRSSLLAIAGGSVLYMLLVQLLFVG